jgi:hypothetical protein
MALTNRNLGKASRPRPRQDLRLCLTLCPGTEQEHVGVRQIVTVDAGRACPGLRAFACVSCGVEGRSSASY